MILLAFVLAGVAAGLVVLGVATDALTPLVAAVGVALLALAVLGAGVVRATTRYRRRAVDDEVASRDAVQRDPDESASDGSDDCGAAEEHGG